MARWNLPRTRADRWTLRNKLIISFVLLATLPICIIGIRSYLKSTGIIVDLAKNNAYEMTKKNNEKIDDMLRRIEQSSMSLLTDPALYEAFEKLDRTSEFSLIAADREITKILARYYEQSKDIFAAQILTSYFTFGDSKRFIPQGGFETSTLRSTAMEAKGALRWLPTYDFAVMFGQPSYRDIDFESRYLFSAVRQLNLIQMDGSEAIGLDKHREKPVLVVNIREEIYKNEFMASVPIEGAYSFIAAPDGTVVSHPNRELLSRTLDEEWLVEAFSRRSGTMDVRMAGQEMFISFDTSAVTGWLSVTVIPIWNLTHPLLRALRQDIVSLAFLLVAISMLLAFVISGRIMNPIRKLLTAIKKMGSGNFDTRIAIGRNDEMNQVLNKFNEMNDNIRKLINENYAVKLREKEAQIMALNVQINPHFLYNTLNIMNWIALENDQQEMSEMLVSLSSMLQYTTHNERDIVLLKDDLEWLSHYILIMNKRFEEQIEFSVDVDPSLYAIGVPKLFLQPFVENAIVHGFRHLGDGLKRIELTGILQDGDRLFRVSDNGRGMEPDIVGRLLDPARGSVGIPNIAERLRIIYGDSAKLSFVSSPGEGTTVTIRFPASEERKEVPE